MSADPDLRPALRASIAVEMAKAVSDAWPTATAAERAGAVIALRREWMDTPGILRFALLAALPDECRDEIVRGA